MENKKTNKEFSLNKKAQGLSITTIILIILGVIILVVLVFGFTMGWSNLKDWVAPSDNVEKIVTQCRVACASNNPYEWCTKPRILKEKDNPEGTPDTCEGWANDEDLGIDNCVAITCP